ncbi:MAG: helix-turn-helix transcriptional regulator [Thermoguttaceae bacterium]
MSRHRNLCLPRGQQAHDPAVNHAPAVTSAEVNPVPTTGCYSKRQLAGYLGLSVRTLDRLAARGDLPEADLVVGRSSRWSPATVEKWLRSRPRLKGGRL